MEKKEIRRIFIHSRQFFLLYLTTTSQEIPHAVISKNHVFELPPLLKARSNSKSGMRVHLYFTGKILETWNMTNNLIKSHVNLKRSKTWNSLFMLWNRKTWHKLLWQALPLLKKTVTTVVNIYSVALTFRPTNLQVMLDSWYFGTLVDLPISTLSRLRSFCRPLFAHSVLALWGLRSLILS